MLKGIPPIISPELLKVLSEMGHGDEIVLADANFPTSSHAKHLIRCDGHGVPELLDAILALFPLDQYVVAPVALMEVTESEKEKPVIWDTYQAILKAHQLDVKTEYMGRFPFYERTKEAFAVIATGERALYGNILLKKGVIADE